MALGFPNAEREARPTGRPSLCEEPARRQSAFQVRAVWIACCWMALMLSIWVVLR